MPAKREKNPITRREFIQTVSAAAGALAATGRAAAQQMQPARKKSTGMAYRPLGNTGLMVSEIGLGGHHYLMDKRAKAKAEEYDIKSDRTRQVAAALDSGINFFDTTYDHEAEYLGHALKTLGRRDECYITCDFWKTKEKTPDELRKAALERFERSLKLLQTDHVEVYRPTPRDKLTRPELDAIHEVFELKKIEGKVRFYGMSGHDPRYLMWAIETFPLDLVLVPYNFGLRAAAEELFPFAKKRGVGVVVIKPFSGGSLFRAGKLVEELKKTGEESVAQAALKFVLANPGVSTVIPGANRVEEVLENARAAGSKLGKKPRAVLDDFASAAYEHLSEEYRWLEAWKA